MFVQVIEGKASDPTGLAKQWQKWGEEVKPGAEGFLGSTGGVTSDGRFIAAARFSSEESARRNSERPEQSAWWSATEPFLDGATFVDCTEVQEWMGGGRDDAGFVQAIVGTSEEDHEMTPEDEAAIREQRPDLIGGFTAKHPDGKTWTTFAYFIDEASAREGEKKPEFEEIKQQAGAAPDENTYFDLTDPWMESP